MVTKISRLLDEQNITYDITNGDDGNKLIIIKNRIGDSGPVATYIIDADRNDSPSKNQHIQIIAANICGDVPRTLAVYKCLNSLNSYYRYMKFSINDDGGDLRVNFDTILPYNYSESVIWEMIVRMVRLIDEVYPQIMKAVWG